MAKMSAVNKNNRRIKLSDKFYKKRQNSGKILVNKTLSTKAFPLITFF